MAEKDGADHGYALVRVGLKILARPADEKVMREKRTEVRLLCADMVEISWRAAAGRMRRTTALLEDISRSGACLQLEEPVSLGIQVRLKCRRQEYVGVVRYCVYRDIGYFVGVRFGLGSEWSPRTFRPQHLLDLRKLTETARKGS